ncbi:probable mitogen-activated protein kinase kinase kinase 12 at C-terminar half [Coccomyxa sp. Obi]|nr:probable mitogen-activated protein kinase kinase kinase 12 at C-terminar half [Coccomyxa sp. Obi]
MASRTVTSQKRRATAFLTGITFHIIIFSQFVSYGMAKEGTDGAYWAWAAAIMVTVAIGAGVFCFQKYSNRNADDKAPNVADSGGCQETLQQHGIILHEVLGRGMFGMVYRGEYQGGIVAVKIAEVTVPRARARTHLTEVKVASSLTHPNVVNLYKAIVERVKISRSGLHSRSSLGSKGSSGDWGDVFGSSPEEARAEGPMSPGALSNRSSHTEAAWSYNRISSPKSVGFGGSDMEGMGSPQGSPPQDYDGIPPPPRSVFQAASPQKTPQRQSSADSSTSQALASFLHLRLPRRRSSGTEGALGSGRRSGDATGSQDLGPARSSSMVTFRCIFVMEFCDAGTLWMAVMAGAYHRADGQPRLHSILCTAVEVAEGVAHMHTHRIVHRDLTTRNVLLKREPAIQRTRAKVSDFGLSMLFKPGQEQAVAMQHGTLAFMPPELLTSDIISYATDVYSFGILMWEIIASKTPYAGLSEQQIIHRKLHAPVDMPSPTTCPALLADLMQACLNRQPSQRPSMATVASRLHALLAVFWSDDDS